MVGEVASIVLMLLANLFWTFREAGVKRIFSEGGVGTINKLLDTRDFLIPDDYLDMSVRKDVGLEGKYFTCYA